MNSPLAQGFVMSPKAFLISERGRRQQCGNTPKQGGSTDVENEVDLARSLVDPSVNNSGLGGKLEMAVLFGR